LKVIDRSVTPNQAQEVRDVEIVSGQTVEKTITFGGAGIPRIGTDKEGQPFKAWVTVYSQSDNKSMGNKSTWYQNKPAEYKLVPGVYFLKVTDRSVMPYQTQEIRDIEIVSGQTVEKSVSFVAGGTLRIGTVKEGQPFNASVSVYRQSDNKSMGNKSTWYQKKPAEYKLVPGVYFMKVTDRSQKPPETKEVRNIEILSGQTVEKRTRF
jgi:Ca-activated chloride channel family protein